MEFQSENYKRNNILHNVCVFVEVTVVDQKQRARYKLKNPFIMFVYYKVVIELNWIDDDCPWVLVRRLRGARSLTGAVLILKCIWPGLPLPGAHWCQTSSEGGRPAEQRRSRTTQTQVGSGPGGQAPAKPAASSRVAAGGAQTGSLLHPAYASTPHPMSDPTSIGSSSMSSPSSDLLPLHLP